MRLERTFEHDDLRKHLHKDMQRAVVDVLSAFDRKGRAGALDDALDDVLEAFSEPMIRPAPRKQTPRSKPRGAR